MSEIENLKELKTVARNLARARRIKHIAALELVASTLGHSHWNALTVAAKKGWAPSQADLEMLAAMQKIENPLAPIKENPEAPFTQNAVAGVLVGHRYVLSTELDDVHMEGRGWRIVWPEAPSAKPRGGPTDRRIKNNPIHDEKFVQAALEIMEERRRQVHARIASDWPRRSTVPDGEGRAQHPMYGELGAKWRCLHCDRQWSGEAMAKNLWHCPGCSASPIDIFLVK